MITRQYTIWCDDKRYCPGGNHLLVDTNNIKNARRMARHEDWRTSPSGPDQCPVCWRRERGMTS